MIKIYHIKRDGNKIDISNLRIKMSISSSLSEVSRTLDLNLYCKEYREIFLGEIIEFNGIEYHIFKKDIDSEGEQMTLICFNKLIYLKRIKLVIILRIKPQKELQIKFVMSLI